MDHVVLSATGRLARICLEVPYPVAHQATAAHRRADHDVLVAVAPAYDGAVGVVASDGMAYRLEVARLPELDPAQPWSLAGAPQAAGLVGLGGTGAAVAGLDRTGETRAGAGLGGTDAGVGLGGISGDVAGMGGTEAVVELGRTDAVVGLDGTGAAAGLNGTEAVVGLGGTDAVIGLDGTEAVVGLGGTGAVIGLGEAGETGAVAGLGGTATVVGLMSLDLDAPPLALGTASGVVKRVTPEYKGWESWSLIGLREGDRVLGCGHAADADDVVFITSDAQLLRTAAREIRPQGRPAGGMAGLKLADGAAIVWFGTVAKADRDDAVVATLTQGAQGEGTAKVTPFSEYPAKGRATGGVRTHRFLTGQTHVLLGWVGVPPVRACDTGGHFRNLPLCADRRDGSGARVSGGFFALGG